MKRDDIDRNSSHRESTFTRTVRLVQHVFRGARINDNLIPLLNIPREAGRTRVRLLVIKNLCTSLQACYSNVTPHFGARPGPHITP